MNKTTKVYKNVTFRFEADFAARLKKRLSDVSKQHKWSSNILVGDILEKWMETNG